MTFPKNNGAEQGQYLREAGQSWRKKNPPAIGLGILPKDAHGGKVAKLLECVPEMKNQVLPVFAKGGVMHERRFSLQRPDIPYFKNMECLPHEKYPAVWALAHLFSSQSRTTRSLRYFCPIFRNLDDGRTFQLLFQIKCHSGSYSALICLLIAQFLPVRFRNVPTFPNHNFLPVSKLSNQNKLTENGI